MKIEINNKFHILIISVLVMLFVFVMGITANSIFADGDPVEEQEKIPESVESTDLGYGYMLDTLPWRITADYELIIGEDGKEYYCNNDVYNFHYPWHQCTINVDGLTDRSPYIYMKKVRFAGTVHMSGTCESMFTDFLSVEEIDLSGLETSGVTSTGRMFAACRKLKEIDLSGFNTSNIKYIHGMFSSCWALKTIDLSCFSGVKVLTMEAAFRDCKSLESVNMGGIDTSKTVLMNGMFQGCEKLESLDISGIDTSALREGDEFTGSGSVGMFTGAGIKEIALGSSTLRSDVNLPGKIRRVKTLDGEPADGPAFSSISEYDGSAPGWYKVGDYTSEQGQDGGNTGEQGQPGGDTGSEHGSDGGNQGSEGGNTGEQGKEGGDTGEQDTVEDPIWITKMSLNKTTFEYTGKRIKPTVTVYAGSMRLDPATDYSVSYSRNKEIGKAIVTVSGKGKYTGTLIQVFKIIPDRVGIRPKTYKIVEGTQIVVSLSKKSKPAYYEFQIAKDRRFRKIIAKKKFAKRKLINGKIYAYKHLKKNRTYYIRVRLIKSGLKGKYSKIAKIKGRG